MSKIRNKRKSFTKYCFLCKAAFCTEHQEQRFCSHHCAHQKDPILRLMARIKKTSSCWRWDGPVNNNGYGVIGLRGRKVLVHRFSYELLIGPIPEGLELDHLCRNRRCANPDHLEPTTHKINCLRGIGPPAVNARKTHCPKGHPLEQPNIYGTNGHRMCRRCSIDRAIIRNKVIRAQKIKSVPSIFT